MTARIEEQARMERAGPTDHGVSTVLQPEKAGLPVAPRTRTSITMRVWRGEGSNGKFEQYEVPFEEGMVVLDAVHRLQAKQAPDLAVRWNCKAGKCGSCSAEVNGVPRLMCMTRVEHYRPDDVITVSPLKTFPPMKDLVTDVSWNYRVNKRITPFTPKAMTAEEKERGEFRMRQEDVDRVQEFRKCIECFLCQNVCHVLRDGSRMEPRNGNPAFWGPRFMIRVASLDMHPKDRADRVDQVRHEGGIGYCNITKCCTEVCPENIKITDNGIIPMKERVVDRHYDPVTRLLRWLAEPM